MNNSKIRSLTNGLLGRGRSPDVELKDSEADVYPCVAMVEHNVFPICEIDWKHVNHYLTSQPNVDSLPYSLLKCKIDFSKFPGNLQFLQHNPSLRVRKGNHTILIPARMVKLNDEIYFIEVKKVSIAHIERQFRFNLMTTPLLNLLPFPITAVAFLGLYLQLFGSGFHSRNEFLPGLAIAVSVASLLTIMWTHLVQHSERSHDAKVRRLENDLTVHLLERVANQLGQSSVNNPTDNSANTSTDVSPGGRHRRGSR